MRKGAARPTRRGLRSHRGTTRAPSCRRGVPLRGTPQVRPLHCAGLRWARARSEHRQTGVAVCPSGHTVQAPPTPSCAWPLLARHGQSAGPPTQPRSAQSARYRPYPSSSAPRAPRRSRHSPSASRDGAGMCGERPTTHPMAAAPHTTQTAPGPPHERHRVSYPAHTGMRRVRMVAGHGFRHRRETPASRARRLEGREVRSHPARRVS